MVIDNYPDDQVEWTSAINNPEDESAGERKIPFSKVIYIEQDETTGEIKEVHCTHDPDSRGSWTNDERKVRGTLHWVSAAHAVPAQMRLYENLFGVENPDDDSEGKTFIDYLNPDSLKVLSGCMVEPDLIDAALNVPYQFLRQGYFCLDPDSTPDTLVFNRTVTLKDTWIKLEKKNVSR